MNQDPVTESEAKVPLPLWIIRPNINLQNLELEKL